MRPARPWLLLLLPLLAGCDDRAVDTFFEGLIAVLLVGSLIGLCWSALQLGALGVGVACIILNVVGPSPRNRAVGLFAGAINTLLGALMGVGSTVALVQARADAATWAMLTGDMLPAVVGFGMLTAITLGVGVGGLVTGARLRFDAQGRPVPRS